MDVSPQGKCVSPASPERSPYGVKEDGPRPQLSTALKERLKRSRRSFVSPLSVAKRLCVDDSEEPDDRQVSIDSQQQGINNLMTEDRSEGSGNGAGTAHLHREDFVRTLRREVKDKMEKLRRLKMVKMYRSKNDLKQLQSLIGKWRTCAQAALFELQTEVLIDGRKADLSEVIDYFGLDDGILHFERAEEDFS